MRGVKRSEGSIVRGGDSPRGPAQLEGQLQGGQMYSIGAVRRPESLWLDGYTTLKRAAQYYGSAGP